MIPRTRHSISRIDEIPDGEYSGDEEERDVVVSKAAGNVISSRIVDSFDPATGEYMHAPVLDIDFPAALIPSSTPGHFHLYLDKPMTWTQYERILKALALGDVIEQGYREASRARKATFVRDPEIVKPAKTPGAPEIQNGHSVGGSMFDDVVPF